VYSHPYWRGLTDLARLAGIRACWSEPIMADKEILGSFAFYHAGVRQPTTADLEFIRDLAALAGIAIVRRRSEKQIERLAFYDVLTDLPNRRLLLDRLEQEIASASRHGCYGAVLYIDLDNFKTLNDSMGHFVGDLLLMQVADRLRACVRSEDTAARLGGDEFVIVLREEDPNMEKLSDKVMVLARRIQTELARPYDLNGYVHHISPSIGITFFSRNVRSPDEVLKQADTAMYSAKAKGRNTISFYHPDMQKHVDEQLRLERDLRIALENGQFHLVFQPQYDQRMRIVGAEALIRWEHPERGLISPETFIPVAEENRIILPIGEWVMEQACRHLAQWPRLTQVSVNISPVQLQNPDFVPNLRKLLAAYPPASRRLMLEVTESIMIGDVSNTASILRELRKLGIGISIDDFGKGYSSLAYLKILPLSELKIDKAFVADIMHDPSGSVIVGTIIAMAKHLRLGVIAEGVETQQQLDFLLEQGCLGFQGYYFSKPLSAGDFEALIAKPDRSATA
jgi:diguanylate cyclase (GGDEF)-like protein